MFTVKRDAKSMETLKDIIQDVNYDILMNVFQMNTEGCGTDIEQSILNALSKGIIVRQRIFKQIKKKTKILFFLAKAKTAQKIELAIIWNRINIAKEEMKKERLEKLTENELHNLLELALLENKYQFVNLLLENEIDLEKFLDIERLKKLYNYEAVLKLNYF
jgi:hypothetical protein